MNIFSLVGGQAARILPGGSIISPLISTGAVDPTPNFSAYNTVSNKINGPAVGRINQPSAQPKSEGTTTTPQDATSVYSSGLGSRNSSGYYGDYTSDQVNALNSQLSQTDKLLFALAAQ